MYAVIKTGGKQYRVEENEIINVELLKNVSPGDQITFDQVLLVADDGEVHVGQPYVEGAQVTASVLGTTKGPKIIVFKHSGRTTLRRKTGHRQKYTQLRIDSITR